MKKLILAAATTFALTSVSAPAAFAGCASNDVTCQASAQYMPAPITYGAQASNQGYGYQGYAPQNYAPVAAPVSYEDEVIVYEERARRKQSYYFKPQDYRTFKCRHKNSTQNCTFEFRGDNADDVEFYLAQALIYATGNDQNQAYCSQKRRSTEVSCAVKGDLSGMDTRKLRYALYGR